MENNKTPKLGLDNAFPYVDNVEVRNNTYPGMSQRLYIATQIVSIYADTWGANLESHVKMAYKYADELLRQENL